MISTPKRGLLASLGVCLSLITSALLLLIVVGGKPSFVTTHGVSMEPKFHTGDLAVLRLAGSYHVGDVAAYHSNQLHTVVMHRIVKIENGRYTFKGDNNSWLDPDHPTRSQLVGKLALRVPHGGLLLHEASTFAPVLIGGIVLAVGAGVTTTTHRRRRGSRHAATSADRPFVSSRSTSSSLATAAAVTTAAAVFAVFLGVMSLNAPTATATPSKTPPVDKPAKTVFSYSAHVGETAAYDQATVKAPATIFRKVANVVDFSTAYTGPSGTFALSADLSTQSGWHSRSTLVPATKFTGASISRTVRLNLRDLDRRAQAAAVATGLPINTMNIDVIAVVAPRAGDPFTSVLHLTMNQFQLSMVDKPSALTQTAAVTPSTLRPAQRAGTVNLLGRHMPASVVLAISGLVLAGCAVSTAAMVARFRRIKRGGESEAIRQRYSALLVPVKPINVDPGRSVVDVPDMTTLAKVAERYGLLVLHWSVAGVETFAVQDESTIYLYRPTGAVTQSHLAQRIDIEDDSASRSGERPRPYNEAQGTSHGGGAQRINIRAGFA
jgi:signal peptidase I